MPLRMERRAQRQEAEEAKLRRAAQERAFAAQTREAMAALQADLDSGGDRFQREQRSLGAERRQAAAGRALWPAEPQRCAQPRFAVTQPACVLCVVSKGGPTF